MVEGVTTDDLNEGEVGNSWFVTACASLTREKKLFNNVRLLTIYICSNTCTCKQVHSYRDFFLRICKKHQDFFLTRINMVYILASSLICCTYRIFKGGNFNLMILLSAETF